MIWDERWLLVLLILVELLTVTIFKIKTQISKLVRTTRLTFFSYYFFVCDNQNFRP